ncbi:MAG: hypothetical protein ACRBN8_24280 [Nannocystales bacterium]
MINNKVRKRLAATGVLTFSLGIAGISLGADEVEAASAKQQVTEMNSTAQAAGPTVYYLPLNNWAQNQLLLPQQPQLSQQQQLILPQQQLQLNQALLQNALYNDLVFQGAPLQPSRSLAASTEFVLD